MATTRAALDTTQYVRITSDPLTPARLLLQSHRDVVRIVFSNSKPAKSNTVFHELGGEDAILPIEVVDTPVWVLAMTNESSLTVTTERSVVEVSDRGSIGVGVYLQDQTTPPLDVPFLKHLGVFSIVSNMVVGNRVFTAVTGHGIQPAEILEFAVPGTNIFMQSRVISVVGDIITIDSLISYPFSTTDVFLRSSDNMLVDGSSTPQVFTVEPGPGQAGDITSIALVIEATSQMDFSTFGSGSALTYGMMFRYNKGDGTYRNNFNWKTNGQFIVESTGHYFQEKAGGGRYGFLALVKFAGQDNKGVALRVDSANNEKLEVVIQDNLIGKAAVLRMLAFGSELQE